MDWIWKIILIILVLGIIWWFFGKYIKDMIGYFLGLMVGMAETFGGMFKFQGQQK
jgi:hypothetical protein